MRTIHLLTIGLLGASLAAAQPCSPADARGTYMFKMWGHPFLPKQMGPTYALGIVTLDGAGKGSGRFTATFGGAAKTLEYMDLQYTVSEACGGTATYRLKVVGTDAVLGPDKLELRILDDGNRIWGLMTDSGGRGAILTSEFRRLSRGPRACHPSMLRGSYSMRYEGWANPQMINPSQPAYFAPQFGLGGIVVDPDGANRGSVVHNWGGVQVAADMVSMTFNVNADCTGAVEYVSQIRGTPNKFSGKSLFVLSGDGAQLTVLMPDLPGFGFLYYERVSIP